MRRWIRILLFPVVLVAGVAAIFLFELTSYITYEGLVGNHEWFLARVAENRVGTGLVFVFAYALLVMLSIPGAAIRTMASGYLFGTVLGAIYAVIGATLGAALLFLIARTSFGEVFRGLTEGKLKGIKKGFQANALNYLLFLRLIPLVPFWLLNLAAAFLDVPLRTFVLATFVGIIPGTVVYSGVGSGLGEMLDQGTEPEYSIILSPPILLPILGLALLSLFPVFMRGRRERGYGASNDPESKL